LRTTANGADPNTNGSDLYETHMYEAHVAI